MNYLAHAFLSFNNPDILAGNMISDYVKGKKQFAYPLYIQKGIQLHRLIDNFTDNHLATARAKKFFRPQYRLYSGAFVDIVYDHFLALDQKQFEEYNGLESFTFISYKYLDINIPNFPFLFQKMYPYMKAQNWLYNYRLKEGIHKSFGGLVHRAAYLSEWEVAFKIFNENYLKLQSCYEDFFPELKEYTLEKLRNFLAD
jgi:acyl carrier protein phosphodiesterase